MFVSISDFKNQCLDLIRKLEVNTKSIEITRHGKVIAKVIAVQGDSSLSKKPWEALRGKGCLLSSAEESVFSEKDFKAFQ